MPAEEYITENPPMILTTPEETIPKEVKANKMSKWVWVGLGILVVAGISAAVAGGGSDGNDPIVGNDNNDGNTGNLIVTPTGTDTDTDTGGGTNNDTDNNTGNITIPW